MSKRKNVKFELNRKPHNQQIGQGEALSLAVRFFIHAFNLPQN